LGRASFIALEKMVGDWFLFCGELLSI
jgi:hypothetical protein